MGDGIDVAGASSTSMRRAWLLGLLHGGVLGVAMSLLDHVVSGHAWGESWRTFAALGLGWSVREPLRIRMRRNQASRTSVMTAELAGVTVVAFLSALLLVAL